MKNLKIKSLMLTLLAMVAVSMMCVSLTACGDDDDDNGGGSDWPKTFSQKVKVDGNEYDIQSFSISELSNNDVDYYGIRIGTQGGGTLRVTVPKASVDKLLDLTKDQRINKESPVTASINSTFAYGDGGFSSGSTLRVSVSGNTVKIVAKGKVLKMDNIYNQATKEISPGESTSHTFDVEYSGTYTNS